jgi:hypothetical protein
MKKYVLIAAIGLCFALEAGAMRREEFEALQEKALVVINNAKETHDSFFSQEKQPKNNIDAIRAFFVEQEHKLIEIFKKENVFLESQQEQLNNRKLSLDFDNWQQIRQFYRDNRVLLADQSEFAQDYNELSRGLDKYRSAIESGRKLCDAKETSSITSLKNFFNDRWAVASVLYLTAYFAVMFALIRHKLLVKN